MAQLTQEKCVACRRDSPRVTDEEIAELSPRVHCAACLPSESTIQM